MKVASGISLWYYRNKYQTQSEWEVVTLSPLIGAFCRPDFTSINIHARVAILSCIGRGSINTHITQENNMSKTPYEIRLELLILAKEILQAPIYEKRSKLSDEYQCKLTDANRDTLPFPAMPDFPSTTDIVAEAEALKKFVDAA